MQGLQSLNQFKDFVSSIGGLGRYEDTYIVHAAEGETVVPMEVLDQNPVLKKRLFKTMMEMGIEPGRYIVGNELNSKNPVTGQPEFFLKKIINRVKKAAADISGYAAPIIGAMYGAPAGALAGGVLGSFKRENPGDPRQGLNMALRGGLAGIASNIATGQDPFSLTGGLAGRAKGLEGVGTFDFLKEPGKFFMNTGEGGTGKSFLRDYGEKLLGLGGEDTSTNTSTISKILDQIEDPKDREIIDKAINAKKSGKFGNMSLGQIAKLYGLGTAALGFLIDKTSDDGDVGLPADTMPEGNVLQGIVNPTKVFPNASNAIVNYAKGGGVMDLQDGGESVGPGTGTSDSIPAMLSDGEFVMTAKAVRGAGGGDRREGAKKMYEAMDNLEARA